MAGRSQSRAAARYRSLLQSDRDRAARAGVDEASFPGQLRFDAIRSIQRGALRDFAGRDVRPVTEADGLRINVRSWTAEERRAISANRTIKNQLNRIFKSFAVNIQNRARRLSRRAYETGLFSSSWKSKTSMTAGVVSKIELTNRAPYAKYVHFAGTPRNQTVVETVIKPMVKQAERELERELVTQRAALLDAIREAVMAGRR